MKLRWSKNLTFAQVKPRKKLSTKIRVKIVPLSCFMYERQNNSHRKIENRATLYVWFHFDLKKLTFIYQTYLHFTRHRSGPTSRICKSLHWNCVNFPGRMPCSMHTICTKENAYYNQLTSVNKLYHLTIYLKLKTKDWSFMSAYKHII